MPDRPLPDPAKVAELKRRLAREPASRSFLELAREYHEARQLEEAAAVCAQGLKYHPNYLSAQVLMGRIYFDMGRAEESRSQMESALAQAPDNLVARRILARICMDQGDIEGALDRYRALLAFNPADSEIRRTIDQIEAQMRPQESAPEATASEVSMPVEPPPAPPLAAEPPSPPPLLEGCAPESPPQEASILDHVGEIEPVGGVESVETFNAPPALAGPASESGGGEQTGAPDTGILATPTLAEIYVRQGLPDKAAEVYREILRGDPHHAEARTRLAEIESAAPRAPDPQALARRRKIEALTAWLERIRRARACGDARSYRH